MYVKKGFSLIERIQWVLMGIDLLSNLELTRLNTGLSKRTGEVYHIRIE